GGPRLRSAPALGHLGPPDGRRARKEPRDRAGTRARRRELLRADDAGQYAVAPGLARLRRGPAQDAVEVAHVLRGMGPLALPARRLRGLSPRSAGRAPRA